MIFTTHSAEETYRFAMALGKEARAGMLYALEGDLGAGKTVFCQGFAAGLGVNEPVNSPTFTILQVYDSGRLPLYHFDVYRLEEAEELDEIGAEEYFYGDGVCLIEWADRIREELPEETTWIRIERDPAAGEDVRILRVRENGQDGLISAEVSEENDSKESDS